MPSPHRLFKNSSSGLINMSKYRMSTLNPFIPITRSLPQNWHLQLIGLINMSKPRMSTLNPLYLSPGPWHRIHTWNLLGSSTCPSPECPLWTHYTYHQVPATEFTLETYWAHQHVQAQNVHSEPIIPITGSLPQNLHLQLIGLINMS